MKQYQKNNHIVTPHTGNIEVNGRTCFNPSEQMLLDAGYVEYVQPNNPTPYTPSYEDVVASMICAKYSANDEIAIIRQRDSKPIEFQEYFDFCEEVKLLAKTAINITP